MKFQHVKGTRDFYPDEMARRNWLIDKWREVSRRSGFVEYDGPTFEHLDLYTSKSGEGIVPELYSFEDRGGRKLALRPEMTPTLARMVAARAHSLPKPIKWFCVPNFFRAERPQRGRLREFWQWNVDIIATPQEANNAADAECIFVAIDFFREVGLTPDRVEMRISSRRLVVQLFESLGIEPGRHHALFAVLDKRDKLPKDEFNRQLSVLGLTEEQNGALLQLGEVRGDGGFDQIERILGGAPAENAPLADLKGVFGLLDSMKVSEYCVFDPGVVRGLAYYTGIVFEAYSKGTLQRAMCGGGRYDNLLEEVGGPAMSGVGYGLGDVIVLDQLEEMDLLPESPPREGFFVINEGMERIGEAMAIVSVVRLGLKQPCNYTYRRASLKKQMQEAAALNVRYVIVVADRLAVKDLETGEQRDLTVGKKLETEQQCEQFKVQLEKLLAEWV